ncbi:DUF5615 family PIN-like protein [candidate division KSB1 bacterium]|nr:DUF5615 family PIN-like protein [candidate division KSB1 bacterium]
MKFLIDVCAGQTIGDWLSQQGHDVLFVRVRNPRMADEDILAWAFSEKRIVVTIDKDFGKLIFVLGKQHSGMIRLASVPRKARLKLVQQIVAMHAKDLENGAIVTGSLSKIRVRRN